MNTNANNLSLIGKRIRELREEKGLSQSELAIELNVKQQTIDKWEKGERDIKTSYTVNLAQCFDVTSDYILGLENCRTHTVSNISDQIGLSEKTIENLKSMQYPTDDELKNLYGIYAGSKNIIDEKKTQQDHIKKKNLNELFEDEDFIKIITLITTLMHKYEIWHQIKCTSYSSDTEWDKMAHNLEEAQAHLALLDYIEQTRAKINDFLKKFQSYSIIEMYHQLTLTDMLIDDEKEGVTNGND